MKYIIMGIITKYNRKLQKLIFQCCLLLYISIPMIASVITLYLIATINLVLWIMVTP